MQRPAAIALFALLLLVGDKAAAVPSPVVAVFDIESQGTRLSRRIVDRLTSYLATKLASGGRYKVVPRDQIKRRLRGQKKRSYRSCYAQSCQIEIGKELAAGKSLAAKLMRIGRRCVLTLTLYDLRSAATEQAATASGRCGEEAAIGLIDRAVGELLGRPRRPPVTTGAVTTGARRAPAVLGVPASPRVSGSLPRAAIQAVVRKHMPRVQRCYERALFKEPGLAGKVVLDFVIGTTGRVTNALISSSTLDRPAVGRCIIGIFRQARFPRPKGGAVQVRYPFVFRTENAPRARTVWPSPRSSHPRASLGRKVIQQRMRSWAPAVQKCYDRFKVPGRALVKMRIEPHGMVSRATVRGAFAASPTGRCIEAVIRRVIFPPFEGDALSITYPFILR